jgi:hypothetical protein
MNFLMIYAWVRRTSYNNANNNKKTHEKEGETEEDGEAEHGGSSVVRGGEPYM